jgi:hypothetical protein
MLDEETRSRIDQFAADLAKKRRLFLAARRVSKASQVYNSHLTPPPLLFVFYFLLNSCEGLHVSFMLLLAVLSFWINNRSNIFWIGN